VSREVIARFAGFWAIFRLIEARCNEIGLAADYFGSKSWD
jgi:hypothetical protein